MLIRFKAFQKMSSEEVELLSDSKYRQFIAAVEKALRSFESTSEWADLISALGKLNKVLNAHSKFVVIPRKLMIGKRLSQCMHPALPSGVHLKGLETYNLIFERIGTKRLSQDLFIYSVGLFPLMSHSAMSVKPVLMKLYEEHFLPLGTALIPSLPGLVLGLLPGIEEGSDYTERTISLLESFGIATDMDIFFDALWQSVITTPAVRLPATIFLLSQLDKHLPPNKQQHLLGKNHSFMVQGLCLALNDSLALVQRNILDFLVQLLPLHSPNLTQPQLSTLMTAALGVLLRRDMSLNRRLYAWILGGNGAGLSQLSGSTSEEDANQYFETFGKKLVVKGMKSLFRQESGPGADSLMTKKATKLELLKPFRILLNLLDKPEIGSAILEDVLVEVFKNLFFSYQHFNPKEKAENKAGSEKAAVKRTEAAKQSSPRENHMEELIKTGNLLFNTFEPYFMWQHIAKLLVSCNRRSHGLEDNYPIGESNPDVKIPTGENEPEGKSSNGEEVDEKLEIFDVIRLTDFILNIVALESSVETESQHWPELLSRIIQELTLGCQNLTLDELEEGVLLCSKLLSKLTPSTNFARDTSLSRNIPSPGLSPTASEFNPGDSIEYDSKTFDDSLENSSTRTNSESSNETRDSPRDHTDQSKLLSNLVSRYSVEASGIVAEASRDEGPNSRDHESKSHATSRDDNQPNDENWSSQVSEHVIVEKFRTPKFEKTDGDKNSDDGIDDGVMAQKEEKRSKDSEGKRGRKDRAQSDLDKPKDAKMKDSKKNEKGTDVKEKRKSKKDRSKDKPKEKGKKGKNERSKPSNIDTKSLPKPGEDSAIEHDSQSMLIRKCIDHYMDFIREFFKWKIFRAENALDLLARDTFSRVKDVEMHARVGGQACAGHVECACSSPSGAAKTYAAMCKLLVELSCFPMQDRETENDGLVKKEKGSLPLWLRCLITCCYQVDDFDIQSTSVSTVLDLINLTLSVNPGMTCARAGVMVIPILTLDEVVMIEKSDIYKVIANSLWSILGRSIPIHHRKAVELLIQLHNLTPSPHLCENVIGSSMVSTDKESRLEALKRFANLWHIAKSILSQNAQGRTVRGLRTFDRSLFVMLDGLESEEPEIRSLTKMWVSHSLEQGDIGRILEPLLLLLLHPSTARISRFYCEREKKRKLGINRDAVGEQEDEDVQDGILEDINDDSGDTGGLKSSGNKEQTETTSSEHPNTNASQRPSDMHKLHYSGKCDYHRILYAYRTLSGVLRVVPRQFVCASAATSIGSSFGPYEERIKELLIRHKRSLLGKGFYGPLFGDAGVQGGKLTIKPNTSKYLEILITITLYFIRSHYLISSNVSAEFLEGNVKTQVSSLECLSNLIWELVKLVRESGHGFGNFITDLLSRCRVQKAIIHCLAATVNGTGETLTSSRTSFDTPRPSSDTSRSSTDSIPESSRIPAEESVDQMILQSKLLEVVESLIVLEHALLSCIEALTPDQHGNSDFEIIMKGGEETGQNAEGYTSRFIQGKSLSSQEMLLTMVLYCLKAQRNSETSSRWTGFVIECLPYLGMDLRKWVVPVVMQMCSNVSDVVRVFKKHRNEQSHCFLSHNKQYPPDHLLAVLAGLTSICHFCLLDAVSSPVFNIQPRAGNTVGSPGMAMDGSQKPVRSMQIFANLLHAFSSNSKSSDSSVCVQNPTPLLEAREGLLSVLPRVIGTLLSIWGAWNLDNPNDSLPSSMALLGTAKALRQNILQLLTPIAMTHTIVFLASVADVWNTKKLTDKDFETKSSFFLAVSDDQLRVISLVLDIKALSLEVVIDTVRQILHQEATNRDKGFEASLLQFFHEFLQRTPVSHIAQAKSSFLALLKDGLQLNLPPPAVFLLLVNLHTYCVKIPGKEDRKSRKETQDVAQRLIESCTSIAGLSLGTYAWFSRNLAVISLPETAADETSTQSDSDAFGGEPKPEPANKPVGGNNAGKHSTQALVVLADVLASLLDIVFGSEEKERVVTFLINVMGNVTPYLRNHSVANVPNFRACSALVASLSGYQYTRKAWRKETFELFFETNFFQMASECVGNWRIIIDNLFTQDQASFRELMARATATSSPGISIFGNHEQEMQQRAMMLKRLSFAVFSSEPDQYQSVLPEIQERLAECLRMPQVPVLHEQVFLFFRVLLLRMSDNMTSIWPMIISEMIHVFLLMESDLLQADTPSRDQQMFYSETVLGASGYVNYSQEKWLGLYLSVCKLLDMALCMPCEQSPQFQMYRWAFEGAGETERKPGTREAENSLGSSKGLTAKEAKKDLETSEDAKTQKSKKTAKGPNKSGKKRTVEGSLDAIFRPYVSRITKLLAKRKNIYVTGETLECHVGRPLLTMYHLESVDELLPFLRMLSYEGRILLDMRSSEKGKTRKFKTGNSARNFLEKLIERDFLDPLGE